jgi:hypothetical protein
MATAAQMFYVQGRGTNLEEAVGLGHNLEFGARFGLRSDRDGQALRADEVARGFDTETFGTGLSPVANPELRLRWRALRARWCEAGVEDRLVLPIKPDPSVTDVLGWWLSVHFGHVGRVDVALNGVAGWDSFAAGGTGQAALGLPIHGWINVTRGLFAGLFVATHYFAGTKYMASYVRLLGGAGAGYRLGAWDLMAVAESLDMVNGPKSRMGIGLGLSWHP